MVSINNFEFVYKLSLPELDKIVSDKFLSNLKLDYDKPSRYKQEKITDQVKNEYKNICGIQFTEMITFFKNNLSGRIHTDTIDKTEEVWGINWIFGGAAVMEYWTRESIGCEPLNLIDSQGSPIHKWNRFHATKPLKIYYMPEGAYLVNASAIHRPSAVGQRHCIVIRPKREMSWSQAIDTFSPLINGVPDIIQSFKHNKFMDPT